MRNPTLCAFLCAAALLGCDAGGGEAQGIIRIPKPSEQEGPDPPRHGHGEAGARLAAPSAQSLEAAAVRVAGFMQRMARYGYFAEQDTDEKRLAFVRKRLSMLPGIAVDDLLSRDLDSPPPSVRVHLLEMDPSNLHTFAPGDVPARLLGDLARLTRGAFAPGDVAAIAGGLSFTQAGREFRLACASGVELVRALNEDPPWSESGAVLHLFEADDGAPAGVSFFTPSAVQAVIGDGFNPYR